MAEEASPLRRRQNLITYYNVIAKSLLQSMYDNMEQEEIGDIEQVIPNNVIPKSKDEIPVQNDDIPSFLINNLNKKKFWSLRDKDSYNKLKRVFKTKKNEDNVMYITNDELADSNYSEFNDLDTKTLYRYLEYDSYQEAVADIDKADTVLLNDCHRNAYYNLKDNNLGRLIDEEERKEILDSSEKDKETEISKKISEKLKIDESNKINSLKMLSRQSLYPILESYFTNILVTKGNYYQFGERYIIIDDEADFVTLLGNRVGFSRNHPDMKSYELNKFSDEEARCINYIVTVSIRTNTDKIEVLYKVQSVVEEIEDIDEDLFEDELSGKNLKDIPEAKVEVKKSLWSKLTGQGIKRKNTKKKQNKNKRTIIKKSYPKKKSCKKVKDKIKSRKNIK